MKLGIVGGGIFGSVAALEFARFGHSVTIFEASSSLISRASLVNQARLHTGMHYPRDFDTALSAKNDHDDFAAYFRDAIQPIEQYYAIGHHSMVSFEDFVRFGERLGNSPKVVDTQKWLRKGVVSGAIRVEESSIDFSILRASITDKLSKSGVKLRLGDPVIKIIDGESPLIKTESTELSFDRVVVATYALAKKFAADLNIEFPPMKQQVTEVVLGTLPALRGIGITVMDGPFWSTMPFGQSGLHSLTSVPYTPLIETKENQLACQVRHGKCGKKMLFNCNQCAFLPPSNASQIINQFRTDVTSELDFRVSHSLFAVKSVPTGAYFESTAARPSQTFLSGSRSVIIVHSGKIGSALSIARDLVSRVARW